MQQKNSFLNENKTVLSSLSMVVWPHDRLGCIVLTDLSKSWHQLPDSSENIQNTESHKNERASVDLSLLKSRPLCFFCVYAMDDIYYKKKRI